MSRKFLITEEEKIQIRSLYRNLLSEQSSSNVKFTVKSDDGETIPGSNVIIYNTEGRPIAGGQTDIDGVTSIDVPNEGVKFAATFVGYDNIEGNIEKNKTNYDISLKPSIGKVLNIEEKNDINITIVGENNTPIEGVKVIYEDLDSILRSGVTNDKGKFVKSGIIKNSEILFVKNGYEMKHINFKGDPIEMSITLKPLTISVFDIDDNRITDITFVMNGEKYELTKDTLKSEKFKYPFSIEITKDGYVTKSVYIDGISSKKIQLEKNKPKERNWRDLEIEKILSTERLLTFYKNGDVNKGIQVSINDIKILNDEGMDSVAVFGSFESYEDKIVLLLKCNDFGNFDILSYPQKYMSDGQIIDKKSLKLGKRYGLYGNNSFYKLLKERLKLCGLNKTK
jgi:hypothetical protein